MKKKFVLNVTEKDRQNANWYGDGENCLVATMLKRKGFDVEYEMVEKTLLRDGRIIKHDRADSYFCCYNGKLEKPFYGKDVVGKKITFEL